MDISIHNKFRRIFIENFMIASIALLCIWLLIIFIDIFNIFEKEFQYRHYLFIFFPILWISFFVCLFWIPRNEITMKAYKPIIYGLFFGYLCGLIAIYLKPILLYNGVDIFSFIPESFDKTKEILIYPFSTFSWLQGGIMGLLINLLVVLGNKKKILVEE